jgi:hypothetical protein
MRNKKGLSGAAGALCALAALFGMAAFMGSCFRSAREAAPQTAAESAPAGNALTLAPEELAAITQAAVEQALAEERAAEAAQAAEQEAARLETERAEAEAVEAEAAEAARIAAEQAASEAQAETAAESPAEAAPPPSAAPKGYAIGGAGAGGGVVFFAANGKYKEAVVLDESSPIAVRGNRGDLLSRRFSHNGLSDWKFPDEAEAHAFYRNISGAGVKDYGEYWVQFFPPDDIKTHDSGQGYDWMARGGADMFSGYRIVLAGGGGYFFCIRLSDGYVVETVGMYKTVKEGKIPGLSYTGDDSAAFDEYRMTHLTKYMYVREF